MYWVGKLTALSVVFSVSFFPSSLLGQSDVSLSMVGTTRGMVMILMLMGARDRVWDLFELIVDKNVGE